MILILLAPSSEGWSYQLGDGVPLHPLAGQQKEVLQRPLGGLAKPPPGGMGPRSGSCGGRRG